MSVPRLRWLAVVTLALVALVAGSVQARLRWLRTWETPPGRGADALAWLRDEACGRGGGPAPAVAQPAVLAVWQGGELQRAYQADGEHALQDLVDILGARPIDCDDPRTRLQLDLVVAEGWLPTDPTLFAFSLVEGSDGVGGRVGTERVVLPPSELLRSRAFEAIRPAPGLEGGLKVGADRSKVQALLERRTELLGFEGEASGPLTRVRAVSTVEGEAHVPKRLHKLTVERPPLTRERLREAMAAGAGYLAASQGDDGRFWYRYAPLTDSAYAKSYSWRRHAGVSWSLAAIGGLLARPDLLDSARRGLDAQADKLADGPPGTLCLAGRGWCELGDAAVALLGFAEYGAATGDAAYDAQAAGLAGFLIAMQRDDGFFRYDWSQNDGPTTREMRPYEAQEAVLALARYGALSGDEAARAAAERGMDHLAGPYWDHFLGRYFVAQEHWTCMAAAEVYLFSPKPEYAELCVRIGTFYASLTAAPGETSAPEDIGGVLLTRVLTPHMGATATIVEAMVPAASLAVATGRPAGDLQASVEASLGYLVHAQITADDTFWMPVPEHALGGIFDAQNRPTCRMDNVQHAIMGMARALELLPELK